MTDEIVVVVESETPEMRVEVDPPIEVRVEVAEVGLVGPPGKDGSNGRDGRDGVDTIAAVSEHVNSPTPHPVYDNGPSYLLLYLNAKV